MRTLAVLAALSIAFAGWALLRPSAGTIVPSGIDVTAIDLQNIFKNSGDPTLESRTIVDYGVNSDGTVSYSYLADLVPKTLDEREVPELRRENSYTKFDKVVEDGADPTLQLTSVFYAQPAFAQDADGTWRTLEYATTSQQAFRDRSLTLWQRVREVFVRTAYADAISPFSAAGDGYVTGLDNAINSVLNTCTTNAWNSFAGSGADYTATIFYVYGEMTTFFDDPIFDCTGTVYRGFLPFDTSAMPGGSTVTAATLNVYVTATGNFDNDGTDFVTVVQTSQATHTQLASSDFGAVAGEGVDAGQRKDITSISTSAYLSFTLNATGMGWIKGSSQASNCSATAAITCLGLQEGHDFGGSKPDSNTYNNVIMSTSENTGTSQDPYLSVTYTAPVSAIAGGLKVGANGSLKITGGGLIIK